MVSCPYCDGKGRLQAPAEVAAAVQELAAATIEHQLLKLLAYYFSQWVETPTLVARIYTGPREPPGNGVVSTMALNLRKKLRPYGLTIEGSSAPPGSFRLVRVEGAMRLLGTPYRDEDAIRLPDARQWLTGRPGAS